MITDTNLWNALFAHQGRLALDKGFAASLRDAGYLHDGNPEAVAREYLRFLYLDRILPGGAVASRAASAAGMAIGGIGGLPDAVRVDASEPRSYAGTLAAYRREFGEPPGWFWPSDPDRTPRREPSVQPHVLGFAAFLAGLAGLFASFWLMALDFFPTWGFVIGALASAVSLVSGGTVACMTEPSRNLSGTGGGSSGSCDYGGDAAVLVSCATASTAACSFSDAGSSAACH